MITAMTIWENRISPVFDSSHMLLIAEIEKKKISNRYYESFNPNLPSLLADRLQAIGVEVLICGAISQMPANIIETRGITLVPFITGNADEVLEHWAKGISLVPTYLMPGCGRKCRNQTRKTNKHKSLHSYSREVIDMPRGDGTGPKGQGPGTGSGKGACKSGRGCKRTGKRSGQSNQDGRGAGQGKNSGNK